MKKDKETLDAIASFYGENRVIRPRNEREAAVLAIKAAVERNPTYSENADVTKIHAFWENLLIELQEKYMKCQTRDTYVEDVVELQTKMNNKFPKSFYNNGRGKDTNYDKKFRIAHAQKSFSVFLKHMWCITDDMPEPPACPIDRRIFQAGKVNGAWTKLNDKTVFEEWLTKIEKTAKSKGMTTAKWELLHWNLNSNQKGGTQISNKSNQQKRISHTKSHKKNIPEIPTLPTNIKDIQLKPFSPFDKLNYNRIHHDKDEPIIGYTIPLGEKLFMLFVARKDNNYFCQIRYCYDETNIDILDYEPFCDIIERNTPPGKEWIHSKKALKTHKYISFGNNKSNALQLMKSILEDLKAPQNVIDHVNDEIKRRD